MQLLKRILSDPDRLLRHSLVMSLAGNLGGALNAVYMAVMCRLLSTLDYNVFQTMLGMLTIISVPAIAIQMAIANFGSESDARDEGHKSLALYRKAAGVLAVFSLPIMIVAILCLKPLQQAFHLDVPWPILVTLLAFLLNVMVTLAVGILQGLQHFSGVAAISVVSCLVRLSGIPLVLIGLGASGAISGTIIANMVFVLLAYVVLRRAFPDADKVTPLSAGETARIRNYFWPVLVTCATTALFMQVDLPLVRMFLPLEEAALYTQAGSVARTVAYLSGPIVMAMFPKIVSQTARDVSVAGIFFRGVGLCLAITIGAAIACSLWPSLPLRILFGGEHPELHTLTRQFVWVFSPMPLYYMFANYLMARRSFGFLKICGPLSILYVAGMWFWHTGTGAILANMATFGVLVLIVSAWCTYHDLKTRAITAA